MVVDVLVKQWRALGLGCVICDYLYVGYSGNASAEAMASDDLYETAFLQNHPLGGLRRAVNDAIPRGLSPVTAPGLDDATRQEIGKKAKEGCPVSRALASVPSITLSIKLA